MGSSPVIHHHLNGIGSGAARDGVGGVAGVINGIVEIRVGLIFVRVVGADRIVLSDGLSDVNRHAVVGLPQAGRTHRQHTVFNQSEGSVNDIDIVVAGHHAIPVDGEDVVLRHGGRILDFIHVIENVDDPGAVGGSKLVTRLCHLVFAEGEVNAREGEGHRVGGGEGHVALLDGDQAVFGNDVVHAAHILRAAQNLIGDDVLILTGIQKVAL